MLLLGFAITGWTLLVILITFIVIFLRRKPKKPTLKETGEVIEQLQILISIIADMEYTKMTSRFVKEAMNQSHIERLIDIVSKSIFTIASPTLVKYFTEDTYMLMIAHLSTLTVELMYKNDLEGKRK